MSAMLRADHPSTNSSALARKGRHFCAYIRGEDRKETLKGFESHVKYYIGQEEVGAHGMPHLQIMFGFNNPRTLSGVINLLKFPNIEEVVDPEAMLKYCTNEEKRDGDLLCYGTIPSFNKKVSKNIIDDALATGNYEDAMQLVENTDKIYYIQNQKKLCLYFTQKFDSADKSLYSALDFNRRLETDFSKCIVLIGSTGLGKTQYALSHFKNPLHVRDREDWRRYSNTIDGIVLDDLDFPMWSALTFLKLLDIENPITQSVKYGCVRIKPGTPRIICVNHEELLWPRNIHDETREACHRRMKIIKIYGPLFSKNKRTMDDRSPQKSQHPQKVQAKCSTSKQELFQLPELTQEEIDEIIKPFDEMEPFSPIRDPISPISNLPSSPDDPLDNHPALRDNPSYYRRGDVELYADGRVDNNFNIMTEAMKQLDNLNYEFNKD